MLYTHDVWPGCGRSIVWEFGLLLDQHAVVIAINHTLAYQNRRISLLSSNCSESTHQVLPSAQKCSYVKVLADIKRGSSFNGITCLPECTPSYIPGGYNGVSKHDRETIGLFTVGYTCTGGPVFDFLWGQYLAAFKRPEIGIKCFQWRDEEIFMTAVSSAKPT